MKPLSRRPHRLRPVLLHGLLLCALALPLGLVSSGARAETLYSGMEDVVAKARLITAEELPKLRGAAQGGDLMAQLQLGFIYAEGGAGLPADDYSAARLFENAASRGQAYAQVMIATLFIEGRGVAVNGDKAMFWFGKAAEQGNPEALYALGALRESGGPGVNADPIEAWKWFSLALSATSNEGKKRTFEAALAAVQKGMTEPQLEVARERLKSWRADHPAPAVAPAR